MSDSAPASFHNQDSQTPGINPEDAAAAAETSDIARHLLAGTLSRTDPLSDGGTEQENAILACVHRIVGLLDNGRLTTSGVKALVRRIRDEAWLERAGRLRKFVGGTAAETTSRRFESIGERLSGISGSAAFRDAVEHIRYAAVFTAHPTFALAPRIYTALADAASRPAGAVPAPAAETHRREKPPTLDEEFSQALAGILRGRAAIDRLNEVILSRAASLFADEWSRIIPRSVILTSWVGYDTDGRTDIGWWNSIHFRLLMKLAQLRRLLDQIKSSGADAAAFEKRIERAIQAVSTQIARCPVNADPVATSEFADSLIGLREDALLRASDLAEDLDTLIKEAPSDDIRMKLCIARAGLMSHGLSASHTHTRLNATQIHNVLRQRLRFTDDPADPAHRRALLARVNDALETVESVPVDFGALLSEQASAARLMMTIAQIIKHIDTETPIRFLIAETESGYTLLSALWLARHFGIADKVEISPLFETRDALMNGANIIEEALRSPNWRDYLRATGRLSLQFGYSDSGRYVGQLASTYLVERLRLRVIDLLAKWDLGGVEVILFDTHGESIGRGSHPYSLADRLDYLSPPRARARFSEAGIRCREESAFQGGDGYLLFGTPALADATIATIAEHVFSPPDRRDDPVYDQPDFSSDFFLTIADEMGDLVEDPGYADLLGAFGPSLIDKTGSRPSARQTEGGGATPRITHPSQLRAIPNNAILQQLGWCANLLQGLGEATRRHPETFEMFRENSPRFRISLDFAAHALAHSDDQVLRSVIWLLDPGYWLDRASVEKNPAQRDRLLAIMHDLEKLDFWADTQSMFRRIQADHLALRAAWPDAPVMQASERLLHALRIALIERLWVLASRIPFFMPRGNFTRDVMMQRVLCLEIPEVLAELAEVFPKGTTIPDLNFHEPAGPQADNDAYRSEHEESFEPMAAIFSILREISVAVMHHVGAFG
ncbi:phosphoenolpyruvate carboxylase [Acetobacter sp. AN02]|uniref:phosphoenolpyruvate carboxylase n=1 Tax=Acetobacter sp. AN02 TaxID=2894186 RepID=UPI0024343D69|nr:phosphoenolpyruvate carboxylase [Acetobacter sp. AN02]MDG6094857.1 phosphoenolpyruvate carboxylase [Acetobacter sp. AN02]